MPHDRLLGAALIALGTLLLAVTVTPIGGEAIVLLIGLGFAAGYVRTRLYGLLVPAAILTGLGTGIIVETQTGTAPAVVLGLGAGFLAITIVDLLVHGTRTVWWWPLIPGGILIAVATSELVLTAGVERFIVPLALIVLGVVVLLRRPGGDDVVPADGAPTDEDGVEPTHGVNSTP